MPIHKCTLSNGKRGWKYGHSGKCYPLRSQAARQARAIHAAGYTGKSDEYFDSKKIENQIEQSD